MIAIAMTVAVAILIGSFRTTVVAWANDTLKADLFVRPMGLGDASSDATFSPSVAATVARLPGVGSIDVIREISIPFRGRITNLGATDLARFAGRSKVRFIGRVDRDALERMLPESTTVLISEPFATKFALDTGDRFPLGHAGGAGDVSCGGGLQRLLVGRRRRAARPLRRSGASTGIRRSTRSPCTRGRVPISWRCAMRSCGACCRCGSIPRRRASCGRW